VTVLQVQGFPSSPSSPHAAGGGVALLVIIVISVVVAASLLLLTEWHRFRDGEGHTLAKEAERWLHEQQDH
jgi:hypothetical protein